MGGPCGIKIIPWDNECTMLTHFKVAKTQNEGVISFFDTAQVILSNIITSDNKNGITVNTGETIDPKFYLSHSAIVGLGVPDCSDCYVDEELAGRITSDMESDANECSELFGLRLPFAQDFPTKMELLKIPLFKM